MTMSLEQAARAVNGRCVGANVSFARVSTDGRKSCAGALFIALVGPRFDAHDFIDQAKAQGAAAVMVSRTVHTDLPQLLVDDTRLALGRLAAYWRDQLDVRVVGVTGSNGKTTTKEMIAAILRQAGPVLATEGNLNNDIGMPLTLLRMQPEHRYAVIEMGANHRGEIAYMTRIARPDVAVITNAGPAHLEGFGGLDGVAQGKGEIYQGLGADGIAVINADDVYAGYWREVAKQYTQLTFGFSAQADVQADMRGDAFGSELTIRHAQGEFTAHLELPGRHNAANALAAATVALALGIAPAQITAGLHTMHGVRGRLQRRAALNGAALIDDTYNANPASLAAALKVLAACPGEKYLALGDMGELGEQTEQLHAEAGALAKALGADRLYAVGPLSRHAAERFGAQARHFAQQDELIAALRQDLHAGATLLVKGSRSARMEHVVEALAAREAN